MWQVTGSIIGWERMHERRGTGYLYYERQHRSSLTALRARVYSTAFSNGCRLGSKFL